MAIFGCREKLAKMATVNQSPPKRGRPCVTEKTKRIRLRQSTYDQWCQRKVDENKNNCPQCTLVETDPLSWNLGVKISLRLKPSFAKDHKTIVTKLKITFYCKIINVLQLQCVPLSQLIIIIFYFTGRWLQTMK